MNVGDVQTQRGLVWIAAGTIGGAIIACFVGMILIAWREDGAVSQQVLSTLQNMVLVLGPSLAGVFAVDKAGTTAAKIAQAKAAAAVATSPSSSASAASGAAAVVGISSSSASASPSPSISPDGEPQAG